VKDGKRGGARWDDVSGEEERGDEMGGWGEDKAERSGGDKELRRLERDNREDKVSHEKEAANVREMGRGMGGGGCGIGRNEGGGKVAGEAGG